jgi:hypothetical protein
VAGVGAAAAITIVNVDIKKIPADVIAAAGGEAYVAEVKKNVLGGGGPKRNPDIYWDPTTREVMAPKPGGGYTPTGWILP